MVIGFVLISVAPTKEHGVHDELSKLKQIDELHTLIGDYDLIAKIRAETYDRLSDIVVDKIRPISGIIDTKTLTGINF
jgi:DNA-binding Lrp family transcriptional regulator